MFIRSPPHPWVYYYYIGLAEVIRLAIDFLVKIVFIADGDTGKVPAKDQLKVISEKDPAFRAVV